MDHFEDALAFCRKSGYRPELAWSCHDYADAFVRRGDPGDSDKALSLIDGYAGKHAIFHDFELYFLENNLEILSQNFFRGYLDSSTSENHRALELRVLLAKFQPFKIVKMSGTRLKC